MKKKKKESTSFLLVFHPSFLIGSGRVNHSSNFFKLGLLQALGWPSSRSRCYVSSSFITRFIIILLILTLNVN